MGDSARRKVLGLADRTRSAAKDPGQKQKDRVMKLAASEFVKPGNLPDLGRSLAATGCIQVNAQLFFEKMVVQPLANSAGVALHITPYAISFLEPIPANFIMNPYILTVECLVKHPSARDIENIAQKLKDGSILRVGYDRAYQGPKEYVVPLMIEYSL